MFKIIRFNYNEFQLTSRKIEGDIICVFCVHYDIKPVVVLCHLLENILCFYTLTIVMFNDLGKYMTDVLRYLPRTNIQKKGRLLKAI